MLLHQATTADGARVDVRLAGGKIEETATAGTLVPTPGEEALDLTEYVLLPAFAEPHAHLDKALTAELITNPTGDLLGAIEAWRAHRRTLSTDDIARRARAAAIAALAHGATAIRSHVDVGEGIELRAAQALVGIRDELRELIDLQLVAMSYPLTGKEGAENRALVREALALGVDLVGGAPHVDPRPREYLDICLRMALESGCAVDLHIDEHLRADSLDLADLARLVATGFRHGATASHCVSLGMQPPDVQADLSAALAATEISVVTCPLTNLYLQGRDRPTATPRGLTPLQALLRAGVTVAGGGDNVQDPFNPLGRGDPIQTAQLLVTAGHVDCNRAYALVSDGARAVMGLPRVRVEPGYPADLVAVRGGSLREVLATATEERIVLKAGRLVARIRVERDVTTT